MITYFLSLTLLFVYAYFGGNVTSGGSIWPPLLFSFYILTETDLSYKQLILLLYM